MSYSAALDLLRGRRGRRPRSEGPEDQLPSPVVLDWEAPLQRYWFGRVVQSAQDWYAGVRMAKFPEDLRAYEHILWSTAADTVIEIGTAFGGSALWFRDRLRTNQQYGRIRSHRVVSIDIDVAQPRELISAADPSWQETITLIGGDVCDPALPDRIVGLIQPGARCLVVEDSAHVYDTTMAALRGFARFVPVGGFFVVEDGYVDLPQMVPGPEWGWSSCPQGVLPAIRDWAETSEGRQFTERRDMELYGLTSHPQGFLQRTRGRRRLQG